MGHQLVTKYQVHYLSITRISKFEKTALSHFVYYLLPFYRRSDIYHKFGNKIQGSISDGKDSVEHLLKSILHQISAKFVQHEILNDGFSARNGFFSG